MSGLFPRWFNILPTVGAVFGIGGLTAVVWGTWYYATPDFFEVGYMPTQPGSGFNHQIHAGMLGIDCRYCHTNVEKSPEANIPSVSTCMGCHQEGRLHIDTETKIATKVAFIREAHAEDKSIEWRRVHKLPDYVRNFPHHVHVKAGVSCFSCHGQITAMPVVFQAHGLGMGWCLDCHRKSGVSPEAHLVPPDKVTQLKWVEEAWFANPSANVDAARRIYQSLKDHPPENCGACHY